MGDEILEMARRYIREKRMVVKRSTRTRKRTANPMKRAKKMWPHRIEGHSELDCADLRMLDHFEF